MKSVNHVNPLYACKEQTIIPCFFLILISDSKF